MSCRVHTFELQVRLAKSAYHLCCNTFSKVAKDGHLANCVMDIDRGLVINLWSECGVTIFFSKVTDGNEWCYMYIRINPSVMLGCTSPTATFEVSCENIEIIKEGLDDILLQLPINIPKSRISLHRLDLCADNILTNEKTVDEYINLLRRGGRYSAMTNDTFNDERDRHSFRCHNTNYQLTVYNKNYQIRECHHNDEAYADNAILRTEICLHSHGITQVRSCYGIEAKKWHKLIRKIANVGHDIIASIIERNIPGGRYYTLVEAKRLIDDSAYYNNKKEALKDFLELLNGRTINIFEFPNREYNSRVRQLYTLGINPITIRARSRIQSLPSLHELIANNAQLCDE